MQIFSDRNYMLHLYNFTGIKWSFPKKSSLMPKVFNRNFADFWCNFLNFFEHFVETKDVSYQGLIVKIPQEIAGPILACSFFHLKQDPHGCINAELHQENSKIFII